LHPTTEPGEEIAVKSKRDDCQQGRSRDDRGAVIEELIPIATVIAAGCESCAEKMVRRALDAGAAASEVGRTLRVVAHLRALDCFAAAVGPEVLARMAPPLRAAERTLQEAEPATEPASCCR
jgi:hypothetical protein